MKKNNMLITKTIEIDMGHRVPNHKSKCKNLHGHRYKIEVGVDDVIVNIAGASNEGMVIDFGDLKEIMMKQIDEKCDHGFMIYFDDEFIETFAKWREEGQKIIIVKFIPTAENICKYWFDLLFDELLRKDIKLRHVKVFETPSSTAVYTNPDFVNDNII